jgi:hypothetical protein
VKETLGGLTSFTFQPTATFRLKRLVPEKESFWNDFYVRSIRIGKIYQGPVDEGAAVNQEVLDTFVFDTMPVTTQLRIEVHSRISFFNYAKELPGFHLHGIEVDV